MKNLRMTLPRASRGFSIMEVLIASSLSLVVTASMIGLMASSLSNTARLVKMTKLTDDLRATMQMMSRDVRRSNYTADAVYCFANPDCIGDGSMNSPGDVLISDSKDCFIFKMDRNQDGDATNNSAGGFRRILVSGVGVIQMWVGADEPECDTMDANWAAVTDPNDIEISSFSVDDALSYTEVVYDDGNGQQLLQKVRKVRMNIVGHLHMDHSIERTIEDVIKLRNNLYL